MQQHSGPRDNHTKSGQKEKEKEKERERQIPYGITYMWNLRYDTNEHFYVTETESWT